jgi:Zn-dependent protease with chaperone function
MNDFFANQEDARRQSGRLLLLFALAVIGVALAVYLVADLVVLWIVTQDGATTGFWHPRLFAWTTAGTLLFIGVTSFWKIEQLREGGAGIAGMLGGTLVPTQTQDAQEQRLRNVVEEMAIASGMPVPELYLLEKERGINAFATGHDVNDAVICVTRGAVELLSRDELQGVVAHEFSHILNGDVLLNLRLLGWLNGILAVSQAGEIMLRGLRRSRGRGAAAVFAIALALYAIGYIGYFFGQLIKSAVSRQREYLGDAAAVQFTRNPGELAGALKKIGGLSAGSRLDHPRAAEVSHMFFGNGLADAWLSALDSHPPLAERIRRLDPRFNGHFPPIQPLPLPPEERFVYVAKPSPPPAAPETGLPGLAVIALLNQVGAPMQEHLDLARRLIADLPEPLLAASRDPFAACAVVYGLLLAQEPTVRAQQEVLVAAHDSTASAAELRRLLPALAGLAPQVRLPLLDLALPALRSLSPEQYQRLKETTAALAAADRRESLFEFTLRYLLLRHLETRFNPAPHRAVQYYGIRGVQKECSCVLTHLARVGHRDENAAQAAFAQGASVLHEPKAEYNFLPAAECGSAALAQAFATLELSGLMIKRRLLAACLQCMVHDQIVRIEEVELFRAIADALGCPVPPWLDLCRVYEAERKGGAGGERRC